MYDQDLCSHLHGRLETDRRRIVPWLDNARSLEGSRILEIGCGTSASIVAIAEQGAVVTGIDVDEGALSVARDRCDVYGIAVEFKLLNATDIFNEFADTNFDFVIFFASLEHIRLKND